MKGLIVVLLLILAPGLEASELAKTRLRETTVHIAIGTGFLAKGSSGQIYMITNFHVCNQGSWSGKMRANYEGGELIEGWIVKTNPLSDLCAVKVTSKRPALILGHSLIRNQQVYTRGYPEGGLSETSGQFLGRQDWTYTYPIENVGKCFKGSREVRGFQGNIEGCSVDYHDNTTNLYTRPGSSGSPVVNSEGELVGVVSNWYPPEDTGGMVSLESLTQFLGTL